MLCSFDCSTPSVVCEEPSLTLTLRVSEMMCRITLIKLSRPGSTKPSVADKGEEQDNIWWAIVRRVKWTERQQRKAKWGTKGKGNWTPGLLALTRSDSGRCSLA